MTAARLLNASRVWTDAGLCVIPAATDGTKRPFGRWTEYQQHKPSPEQHQQWFGGQYDGLGIVCGAISGNVEMFELEGRAVAAGLLEQFEKLLTDHGYGDLWGRIDHGYSETTPSGGIHWLYRVDGAPRPNLKLASRPATTEELAAKPDEKIKVLIETRGEGGFSILAPSGGRTHPDGGRWEHRTGHPRTIATVTEDERDALHAVAAMLDRTPVDEPVPPRATATREPADGELRPGDDFNERASWDEVLVPHGWTAAGTIGTARAWTRPGKKRGISATTGRNDGDNFYVFSTSTEFQSEKPYSKFAAYALLNHRNDYAAAARELGRNGYGTRHLYAISDFEPTPPAADAPWEPPQPLSLPVPAFPLGIFGWLEQDILDLADELQTPVDLIAMLTLATLAAAVRGRAYVTVKGTWVEPLNLYVAVIAGPGETKSPALAVITAPLRRLEQEYRERSSGDIALLRQQRRLQEGRLKRAEAAAVNASQEDRGPAEDNARREREKLDAMREPHAPQFLVGDATAEALVRVLAEQNGVVASLTAEGGLLDTIAGGRYSNGMANLDAVLQAHDGREPILVDRKVGDPIRVDNPCLTLGMAVQPHVISSAGRSEAAMGRGFLARFLFSYPESQVGSRVMDRPASQRSFEGFERLIRRVEELLAGGFEDLQHASLKDELRLSSLSLSLLDDYRSRLEPRRGIRGDLGDLQAWANKLDGQIARLAGLIQLLYLADTSCKSLEPPVEVGVEALSSALDLADYLIGHALAAHRLMSGDPRVSNPHAAQLLGWLRDNGLSDTTVADAYRHLRGRTAFRQAAALQSAFDALEQLGYLRRVPDTREPGKPGRPASPRYLVNPLEPQ